ncbi:NAD(P)/FAD-dependent oxidoreductase [Rhodococcus jostii]|uniref:NAD(P)/FAD-dependent oxidoreductase n=1 Tax=Rhodococcus jostii TaxID=132919 RepID=A0ABU4CB85_RHOJO|nr:NAD(P)/FAD-dependent oxidoreductase [Rhodococcus jostii]MDV6280812.1 NAD(P)/FAD-dependent oxidoreductase [Rhodococcus jostii]
MTAILDAPVDTAIPQPGDIARRWLAGFGAALERGDVRGAAGHFLIDGWWRDLLSFTWDLHTTHGRADIESRLADSVPVHEPRHLVLSPAHPAEAVADPEGDWIQAFFTFETTLARSRGFVRLRRDGDGEWRAWTLISAMEEIKGHEEKKGYRRVQGTNHGAHRGKINWLDRRTAKGEFETEQPAVVIVGAGQGGLALAARLGQLGVDTLLVERNDRIGDSWRKRYHSLVLHDPVWYDHLPYLNFPDHWPVFTPKDKLANWFEFYAEAMELNVWTGTEFTGGSYDDATGEWTVTVARDDGSTRTLHPRHVVLATGMSGVPNIPRIAGADTFEGTIEHSSWFVGGREMQGKKALVVGCCNSGHDIAQELNEQGADVTILQRSSTYVMSSKHGIPGLFGGVYEEGGPAVQDADLIFASLPYPLLAGIHAGATEAIAEKDAEMLDGLRKAGFKVDFGEDGSGLFMKYLRRGGGYYIDVGASELIASGEVTVKQGTEIDHFTPDGVVFADGTEMPVDVVVLATGYKNMRESARKFLGDAVADRCQDVWGLDDEGELRTVWRRSGHPGFWFMAGNLHQSRHYSKYLAFQIKAQEEGLQPIR